MSAFMNKKTNMGISSSVSSGTQAVAGAADITLFNSNGFDVIAGSSPHVYLPTSSTIYLPKGFYYFVECSLKMYRSTNANYLDYAIVDSSNVQLSNTARVIIVSDAGIIEYSYPKKAYAFIDCISSSKTIKIRTLSTYDITAASSGSSLTINGSQDVTSATNYVHSEPMSNIIIKSWNSNLFNSKIPLSSDFVSLANVSQLTSASLNKYHTYSLSNTGFVYYMPVSPSLNDIVGFVHSSGTGNFRVRRDATGIFLTPVLDLYAIRKTYVFKWDGTDWIDIGEFIF